jgi:hypothetical protein
MMASLNCRGPTYDRRAFQPKPSQTNFIVLDPESRQFGPLERSVRDLICPEQLLISELLRRLALGPRDDERTTVSGRVLASHFIDVESCLKMGQAGR